MTALLGAARSLPTLGLLTLFGLWLCIGLAAPMLAKFTARHCIFPYKFIIYYSDRKSVV